MRWRSFMLPLALGAVLGAHLMWVFADVGSPQTVALVLLAIQIPILIWDTAATIRLSRDFKETGMRAYFRRQSD